MAEEVPGFGGFYQDRETRKFHVYLTDLSRQASARQIVTRFVRAGGERNPQFVFLQGDYDFRDLARWRLTIDVAGWEHGSVTLTDVDETQNRILVGARDQQAVSELRLMLPELEIPGEAVEIRVIEEVVEGLQSVYDTLVGGIRIRTPGQCTLTGVAVREQPLGTFHPDEPRYLMTASHCTSVFGTVTGETMGQPDASRPVGTEFIDPPLHGSATAPGCPTTQPRCRFSDAVLFAVIPGVHTAFDSIAIAAWGTPTTVFPHRGPLSGRQKNVWTGQYLEKVGQRTGRTGGFVTNTCVTHSTTTSLTPPVPRHLLCQVFADYHSDGGDSGAPVYYISTPFKRMIGVHRGRNNSLGVAVFSALWYAESEIANELFQQTGQMWWPALSAGGIYTSP